MESFKISEEFIYYLWSNQKLNTPLKTIDNQHLEVIHPGVRNHVSGPDFSNARIKIDDQIWFGNVEIHIKSSDWIKHNHENDPTFDSIILHVVYENDVSIDSHTFRKIPTLELRSFTNSNFVNQYKNFLKGGKWIPCENEIHKVEKFQRTIWLQRLLIERLESKSKLISEILNTTRGNWEQTFLIVMSRSFGFKYNALPFEQLGKIISVQLLQKSQNIEALIFGLSGLLPTTSNDFFVRQLIADFTYEQKKWNLNPVSSQSWKTGGLRPYNSPYLRLAQLSKFLNSFRHGLLQEFLTASSLKDFRNRLQCQPSEYWKNHFSFEKPIAERSTKMSHNSVDLILVNAVVPFLFVYGRFLSKPQWEERALDMLQELAPDKNAVISNWKNIGFLANNAADSQALLQLYKNYCSLKKCLFCTIGTKVLNHD